MRGFRVARSLRARRGVRPSRASQRGKLKSRLVIETPTINHPDEQRVDHLLQYVLVRAAQEDDWRDRELGPIHLLKYAYLADWAYAERHDGQTFTGAAWQFYHFGPWHVTVHDRIEPALAEIHADKRIVRNARYDDDLVRFTCAGHVDRLRDELENQLPAGVARAVAHAVHEFGGNTAALLRHVYLTPPMVRAAPGEILVFAPPTPAGPEAALAGAATALTAKERKRKSEALSALKETVRERLAQRVADRCPAVSPPPRYDEVFAAGTEWLDVIAGEPVEHAQGELTVSPDVWKSAARGDPDVP